MFFTQEDYLKIEKWLKARAVKDSQFPELTDYDQPNSDDYFVILQGNKTNAKVKVTKAFLHIYNGLQNRPVLRGSGNYSLITDSKWTTRPNEASGEGSIAIGLGNNKASKYLSVAIGQNNIVDSQFSWGLGSDNNIQSVNGYNKVFGNNNTINKGSRNYIIGDNNNLQYSSYNYVFGLNNYISGSNSSAIIIGSDNYGSDGGSSIYIGKGLEGTANDGIASINLGQYNINVPGNRYLFTIGNGKDGNRSNTLSIEYNGDINIQNIGSRTLQAYLKDLETSKQNKLIAGAGIEISSDNTISCILDTTIFVVVDTLPLVPEDTNINKIHLVKDTTVSGNLYSEYLYVNNTWEKLGDFQPSVDLSEYAKTADIPIEKGTMTDSIVQKGSDNDASGNRSSAFGWKTRAAGNMSHTEGFSTFAQNSCEHAEGLFNISIQGKTIHTVGIGTSSNKRKNAHEIHLDGKHYIYGIGGYDGTNSQTEGVKTVQEVVREVANVVQITYAELKSLRDSGKLVPGTQYRITDYTCTTIQENTKSAGHIFDIIVTADDERTLNEVARAVKHEGDAYFANSDLNAWKIWYCLDNDTNRFEWADGERLIDTIAPMPPAGGSGTYIYSSPISKIVFNNKAYNLEIGVRTMIYSGPPVYITKTDDYTLVVEDEYNYVHYNHGISVYTDSKEGKGVIYRMIDEFNNDIPYDFKNIQFKHPKDKTTYPYYYYTFASSNVEDNTDCSLDGRCYSNIIKKYTYSIHRMLNHIIFIGTNCYGNSFGDCCHNNSFGSFCQNNSFGDFCQYNSFGYDCQCNSFGNSFSYNSFGDCCHNNSFGNMCLDIKFTSDSSASTKYNYYQNNHFGDGCQYIIFTGAETASSSAQVQNYNFAQGLQGTSGAYLTIDGVRGRSFETKVAMNSNEELKVYCEADLIL